MTWDQLVISSGLPRAEARLLLALASGRPREWLLAHGDDELGIEGDDVLARFQSLGAARRAGWPIAYLLGQREFFGRWFDVDQSVLIPRPETELLVEQLLRLAPRNARVLDLGTGSGNIAITALAERPDLQLLATDASQAALQIAIRNAARLVSAVDASAAHNAPARTDPAHNDPARTGPSRTGPSRAGPARGRAGPAGPGQLEFRHGSWWSAVHAHERFDIVVSNPPYIAAGDVHLSRGDLRFEPASALTDHLDGLAAIGEIITHAPMHLLADGWLLLEHGWDQAQAVQNLLRQAAFERIGTELDLAGHPRVTAARWPG